MSKWEYYLRVGLVRGLELARLVLTRDGLSWMLAFMLSLCVWVVSFIVEIAVYGESRPDGKIFLPGEAFAWPIIFATLFFVFAPALFEVAKRVKQSLTDTFSKFYEKQKEIIAWYQAAKKLKDETVAEGNFFSDSDQLSADKPYSQRVKKGRE